MGPMDVETDKDHRVAQEVVRERLKSTTAALTTAHRVGIMSDFEQVAVQEQ